MSAATRRALTAPSTTPRVSCSAEGSIRPTCPSWVRIRPAASRICSRWVPQLWTTASITIRKLGIPWRWVGGK